MCFRYWCQCSFFFFQAEDGIRDDLVTGVQTCALPIYHVGPPSQNRVHIHFLENRAFILDFPSWNDLQLGEQLFDRFAPMSFDDPDHDVFATAMAAERLAEHAVGLADTRRVTEEQFENSPGFLRRRSDLQPIFGLLRQRAVYST